MSAQDRFNPVNLRIGRFQLVVYKTANRAPWFGWNEYRQVLTDSGVGVRIGCAFKVGRNWMLSLVWKRP